MHWFLKILLAHKRLRGLSESQLRELIETVNDTESLKVIKEHLENGSFKYGHLQGKAPALIQECIDKAKELQWQQHAGTIKKELFDRIGDPLAWAAEKAEWLV